MRPMGNAATNTYRRPPLTVTARAFTAVWPTASISVWPLSSARAATTAAVGSTARPDISRPSAPRNIA